MENVSPIIAPDREQMLQHLGMLFGRAPSGQVEITAIHTDKATRHPARTRFFDVAEMDAAAEHAAILNAEPGWNVYVGAALRNADVFPNKAADDDDFYRTYAVWADADDGEQLNAARNAYRTLGVTPPFVVVTGRTPSKRAQLWWPLEDPIQDIDVLRATLRGIAASLKTDPKVCTGKQLMRLGGGVNWPKKEDRILERTEVVRVDRAAREFPLEQIQRAFPPRARAEMASAGALPEVEIAHGGALGLEERVMDGRETYAFKLVRAHLREWIGTTGSEPTADELYKEVAPVYLAKADQVRPGRGPAFLMQKCAEAVRAYHSGQIPGMRNLEEAVMTWAQRQMGAFDPEHGEGDEPLAEITQDDLYEVLSISDLKALPPADWLVEDAIPRGALGFGYGAPASFKSFIWLDLGLSIAYGFGSWMDRPVKRRGSALYIASEGVTGIRNRITAWQKKHGIERDDGAFQLIRRSLSFLNAEDVHRLERTVAAQVAVNGPVDLIFVDTVSRVLPGADENLQKDMTLFVAACDRLRERFGATVIGVHHTNKNGDMRGSTVFLGQGDFIFRIDRDENARSGVVTCEKQKEAEDGWKVAFAMEPHAWLPVGQIKEVTSLTVRFGGEPAREVGAGGWPGTSVCRAALKAVEEAWSRGHPWSPYRQSQREGRYAVENLARGLGIPGAQAEMMVLEWQRTGVLAFDIYSTKTKLKGLRVASWPEWSEGGTTGGAQGERRNDDD